LVRKLVEFDQHSCCHTTTTSSATLRYFAGGSYIDISELYQLSMRPQPSFWKTIQAIDQVLDNIQIPKTSREWISLSEE
jgi:uncharacterized protein (DUF2236 family)